MKTMHTSRFKTFFTVSILLGAAIVSMLLAAGCSMSGSPKEAAYYDASEDMNAYKPDGRDDAPGFVAPSVPSDEKGGEAHTNLPEAPSVLSEEKLVYTCDMTVETTKYQETASLLKAKIKEFGGIIESETETDSDNSWYYSDHKRYSASMRMYLVVRIPATRYSEFVESAGSFGKVRQKSQNVENISRRYSDTEARIRALETEEKRLLEMLGKASTVEEMLYVEKRLTEVEYELASKRSALSGMDVDVAYSTVNITLTEVLEYTEEERPAVTFIQRIGHAFSDMWENLGDFSEGFVIVLIYLIPLIVVAGIVLLVIFIIRKARDKKYPERVARRKARKEAKRARKYGVAPVTEQKEEPKA